MKKLFALAVVLTAQGLRAETGAYKTIVDQMRQIETAHPKTAAVFSIGNNQDGVPLYALRISTDPSKMDANKIGQLVVGTHHGNERHAAVSAMHFAQRLVTKYESNVVWQSRLADTEFTVLPVLNVSGYNSNRREEAGRDPNRNYAGPCNSSQPTLGSIKALVQFLTTRLFAATVTIHGYIGVLAYPWGFATTHVETRDQATFDALAKEAASHNGYRYGTSTDTIYPATGTYEDYVYWKHGIWSLLVELYNGSTNDIADTSDAMYSFFENVDSSPSVNNQHDGQCTRRLLADLRMD
ncbi:hypothetical protein K2X33_02780 [bacterium]|nr:hypothetical protein [bacterium]